VISGRRIRRDESGAASVEFAIVATLLLTILFGILVYGLWLSEYNVMQSAAREGARVASVRGTTTQIQNAVTSAAGAYSSQLTNMPATVSVSLDGGTSWAAGTCDETTIGDLVKVEWDQTFKGDLLPFVPPLPNTRTIKGVFRCE
jgi:Flp pilus assembly protein TadG